MASRELGATSNVNPMTVPHVALSGDVLMCKICGWQYSIEGLLHRLMGALVFDACLALVSTRSAKHGEGYDDSLSLKPCLTHTTTQATSSGGSRGEGGSPGECNLQDLASRSDGKEVTVDDKELKANNPLLLISYYEQHLRYNLTS
ncbi:hypothetical protein GUJ93_ZPchr0012g19943 [Zizania palustris]|uniref:Uncharacterized protein n=1 Tax=Zizania palustris TaxID=103762 RepID=A0A8J6BS25_ZIZPA|nr:hypothetical protein GUJ93_ZPchr0012g19943 [Zizania palustris]